MSKMSELAMVLSELKQCGESLMHISDELTEIFSTPDVKEPKKEKASVKKKEPDAKPEPEDPKREYTFTEVRTFLADKSRAGHTEEDPCGAWRGQAVRSGQGRVCGCDG